MIAVRNLSKVYGERLVIRDVTFNIARGGITSIIGPNGAGKSTLLGLISRLIPATSGSVHVDALNVASSASDALARRLSILRQDNHITARLTVRDLVAFGRFPHSKGRLTDDDRRRVDEAIAYLGLNELRDRFLDEMSGGQRQRAFVAMVLCQDTDYVLMDEPLNSLDMRHATAMMKLIRKIADDLGKTFVLVLHDINYASVYSDEIVGLRDGQLIVQGRPHDVVRPAVIKDIFDVDVRVQDIDGQQLALFHI